MSITVHKQGPVTTVVVVRPDLGKAVDRDAALALAEVFRTFEADPEARAVVLWGPVGSFCEGPDLRLDRGPHHPRVPRLGIAPGPWSDAQEPRGRARRDLGASGCLWPS